MPSRRGPSGPSPFSSDYSEAAPPPPRRRPVLPAWLPSAGVTIVLCFLVLSLIMAMTGGPPPPGTPREEQTRVAGAVSTATATAPAVPLPTETPTPWPTSPPDAPTPTELAGLAITPIVTQPETLTTDPRAILPRYRILSYYGHPHTNNMGILGEFDKEELLAQLNEMKAAYEAADPSRPVILAFEVIASIAQNWPADNDTYLLHTDNATIQEYIEFAAENGALVILDVQIGHSSVRAEIDRIEEWLLFPNVHLAIDPEFAMPDGVIPGASIGGVDAADITYAQERLAKLAADNDLPPKLLIVHQFYEGMIRDSHLLAPVEGVQLLIEFDGFGHPANKIAGYNQFVRDRPIEFGGIKLFFRQDDPLLTPAEIVALQPSPDLVIYH